MESCKTNMLDKIYEYVKEKFIDNSYIIVWLLFAVYLLCQHSLVWMYLDDYGYASLNYAVSVGTTGNDYSLFDIIRYCYAHYVSWGGRVLYYGIAIFIYHFIGLWGMRIVQSLIVFCLYYYTFRIVIQTVVNGHRFMTSIVICSLFGVFQIGLVNTGLYWFSAATGYVWPILPVLIASYVEYGMIKNQEMNMWKWFLNGGLWFLASFSQEQIAVASFTMCVGLMIYGYLTNRKYLRGGGKFIFIIFRSNYYAGSSGKLDKT